MRTVLPALPPLAYLLLLLVARLRGNGWRASLLHAAVIWGMLVALFTEALGALRLLAAPALTAAWFATAVFCALYSIRTRNLFQRGKSWREALGLSRPASPEGDSGIGAGIAAILLVVLLVAAAALAAPPNTWDAMDYHLPRVVQWLQNRSVEFYPTAQIRSLYMPPWAEYAMLHLHALAGGDRFDNLVQWFSLAGCAAAISLLAQALGAGARGQVLAGLAAATIPQAVLQASGPKNDVVLAFWLAAAGYYLFQFRARPGLPAALGFGAAAGLALFTKGTAYIWLPLLAGPLAISPLIKDPRRTLRCLAAGTAIALILNTPHYIRNYRRFGAPLGPSAIAPPRGFKVSSDRFGPGPTVSGLVRNIALHLGTPSPAVNQWLTGRIAGALKRIGEDVNDPATTWDGAVFAVPETSRHESTAGNPLHLALIAASVALSAWRFRRAEWRDAAVFSLALALMFTGFCAALKWQPWHTRLQLPFFVLGSALAGAVLPSRLRGAGMGAVPAALLLMAGPALLDNQLRPLLYGGDRNVFNQSRDALRFMDRPEIRESYFAAAKFAAEGNCARVGLDHYADGYFYPLYALLAGLGVAEIREVNAPGPPAGGQREPFEPCAVICPGCARVPGKLAAYSAPGGRYQVFGDTVVRAGGWGGCSFTFSGWYPTETGGGDWWRWTSGQGALRITVERDSQAEFAGELVSLKHPNQVRVLLNGAPLANLDLPGPGPLTLRGMPLPLRGGTNVIELLSANPAATAPADSRPLALALRNARLSIGGEGCSPAP